MSLAARLKVSAIIAEPSLTKPEPAAQAFIVGA
jgi:hypothetical protein